MSWWRNSDEFDDVNEVEIKATLLAMFIVGVVLLLFMFQGCSTLRDSDERTLEIDCKDCVVKYKMSLDVDKAHIKEHIK